MLGSNARTFETPNVIDPGDLPPSRPIRNDDANARKVSIAPFKEDRTSPLTSSTASDNSRSLDDYQEARETRHRLLNSLSKIDAPYDPYMNDEEIGDESPHSLPSPEEARMYAISVLGDAKRINPFFSQDDTRTQAHRLLSNSSFSSPSREKKLDLERTVLIDAPSSRNLVRKRLIRIGGICCAACLLVAVLLSLSLSLSKSRRRSKPHAVDTNNQSGSNLSSRHNDVIQFLLSKNISSESDLTKPDTPQYLAAIWIADRDKEQLPIPLDIMLGFRFVQRYVLAVFFHSTRGPQWTESLNFMSDMTECSWFIVNQRKQFSSHDQAKGVVCDDNFRVQGLFLRANNLQGSLPSELQYLTGLTIIDLASNFLGGTMPNELQYLRNVSFLNLNYNELTGTFAHWLGDWENLEILGLSNNHLAGTIRGNMGDFPRLKTLAIDNNMLEGSIEFGNYLTNLEYFYADHNIFQAEVNGTFLIELSRLRELDLSSNELMGTEFPFHFFEHRTLHVLDLGYNNWTSTIPDRIAPNYVMYFLSLRGNNLIGTVPSSLRSLEKLTHLDLEGNAFNGSLDLLWAPSLTDLSYLFLGHNNWLPSPDFPPLIAGLTSLRELSLAGSHISSIIPHWLARLTNLRLLDLADNVIQGTIPSELIQLSSLNYLMLHNNQLEGTIPSSSSNDNFLIFTMHKNAKLVGDVSTICKGNANLTLLAVDCTVTCPKDCCLSCCKATSNVCFVEDLKDYLLLFDYGWEYNFNHAPLGFDPANLDAAQLFQIVDVSP